MVGIGGGILWERWCSVVSGGGVLFVLFEDGLEGGSCVHEWGGGLLRGGVAEVAVVGHGYPPRLVSAGVEGIVVCLWGSVLVGTSTGWGSAGSLSELVGCVASWGWADGG